MYPHFENMEDRGQQYSESEHQAVVMFDEVIKNEDNTPQAIEKHVQQCPEV